MDVFGKRRDEGTSVDEATSVQCVTVVKLTVVGAAVGVALGADLSWFNVHRSCAVSTLGKWLYNLK